MGIASLGVCYYPEHWPRDCWPEQAAVMREGGIELVRIGEFAWSRIEPAPGKFDWDWLDGAIETLACEGLKVVMCTPTACPPRWLVGRYPDILPVDHNNQVRRFGSRRHYRFASDRYLQESLRISQAVVERYAEHPAVVGWQLDNEYGCHDTTLSYADDDESCFQRWLESTYESIDALNNAWGTVFWSQEYQGFTDIGRPNLTVTEANPAHRMAYWRFASEQVRQFNAQQRRLLRESAGRDRWVTHNFMGNFTDFDHFAVAEDLDIASWDSYPLGFLDQGWFSEQEKLRYRQLGHPDWAAFHHDLYRAVGRGRLAVMEQQPGPVNWAESNAQPLPGAAAFWAMEAVAHGAEFVSFFRFQQLPVAQEQMHAALRLPNGDPAPAWQALQTLHEDLQSLPEGTTQRARVALLFDYPSCWATAIQPHAPGTGHLENAFMFYSATRQLGVDIDIVDATSDLDGYALLLVPGTVFINEQLVERIAGSGTHCLIGARSGSRTADFALSEQLPPGPLQALLPVKVVAVDSMRPQATRGFTYKDQSYSATRWFETLETALAPLITCDDGSGLLYEANDCSYLNAHVPIDCLTHIISDLLGRQAIPTQPLAEGLRLRRRGELLFAFNFSPRPCGFSPPTGARLCGPQVLEQGSYAVYRGA